MTKSTITRDELNEVIATYGKHHIAHRMANALLAAMDSEPVAWTWHYREQWHVTNDERRAEFVAKDGDVAVLPLYRHAQPVPVVSAELLHTAASAIEDLLTTKGRMGAYVWFDLPFRLRSAANAQPAPVVPDDVSIFEAAIEECKTCDSIDEHAWNHGVLAVIAKYESCRAAMLQELKKSAGTEAICRSDENVQVLHTKSPAQSDCCPAQNSVTPAQGGNSLVIPDEMTSGQAYEIGYYYGDPVDVFARGANWMRQHIIDSTLAAAPQEVKGE